MAAVINGIIGLMVLYWVVSLPVGAWLDWRAKRRAKKWS